MAGTATGEGGMAQRTEDGRGRVLGGGVVMPLLGLGVWQAPAGRGTEQAVRWALEAGYRHVDTAQSYGNEESVGVALRTSGIPRDEIFVTTKFRPASRDPERAAEESLRRLGLERMDLYLVHWPQGGPTWMWPAMERVLERGLTRAIGVSNYSVTDLDAVVDAATHPPVVNQVQFSPFQHRRELLDACERHGIALEAYSPLTRGRDLDHPVIRDVAERHGRTAAQVLLRWCVQRDVVAIPKSTRQERIVENGQVFDFALTEQDVAALDGLDRTGGTGRALERPWW